MRSIKSLAIGAGFCFVTLAMFVQGFLPAILPESRTKQVSRAVRTDLGDVKWVRYDASDYTPLETLGRAVYIREGCWYCHSQYVRPVAGEELRWGPVSEAGEYAFDLPHLFSTRRIGPDLTRVGLKYADDWHYAHHWDPRLVVPESIMPSFKWLFEQQNVAFSVMRIPQSADLVARGKEEYGEHCIGCHGAKGDGNGLAATFLSPRPRDFTIGAFKFRSTPSGSLPTDGDLFRTVTRGVRWTAMPTWHEVPDKARLAGITYIKTFSRRWEEEHPEPPVVLPTPPPATSELLARGKQLYVKAKCWECHGDTGRGDGPSADQLKDDLKFPIRPPDFTKGQFKGGSDVTDIYRTMTLGLDGTPMPSFADSMNEAERWAISYFVLSFSAWADPLTGQKLQLSPEAKASLNSPDVRADHPRLALDPERESAGLARANGRRPRVYYPGIRE